MTHTGRYNRRASEMRTVSGVVAWSRDWTTAGACQNVNPDELFVQGAAQNRAKAVCHGCLVRTECLADSLDNKVEFGVWGGMTERERRALLRRRPNVSSWRRLLEAARADFDRRAAFASPAESEVVRSA